MPVNSVSENQKGLEKPRFSLSLNKKNAAVSNENRRPLENSENCRPNSKDKENRPVKRTLNGIYSNTVNAAKRLKPLAGAAKLTDWEVERELVVLDPKPPPAMLNGHHPAPADSQYGSTASVVSRKTPIATLSNLGNTCFLNSVLYTLRFAPRFLHNLHHLVSDLASVEQKLGSIRLKSSSLGRSAAGLASSGARSWSSKDLLSLGQADTSGKSKIQIATEKLHETYLNLRVAESKCLNSNVADASPEPYAADAFLAALRDVNSTFEGNRQQDAHELLVCILDNIRETCKTLSQRASRLQLQENGESNGIGRQPSLDGDGSKATLSNIRKSWKKRREVKDKRSSPTEERAPSPQPEKDERSKPGWDFVAEDFEGTMIVRTMCMECESVTEKAQPVCELCVPVGDDDGAEPFRAACLSTEYLRDANKVSRTMIVRTMCMECESVTEKAQPVCELCVPVGDDDGAEPFRAACLSTEYLRDANKYWCERCLRLNEARRSVAYSRLPRLLVLQLKRFSGGMEKITRHAPTPLNVPCFCEPCTSRPPSQQPRHRYSLWAVIMHLGQNLTGGHYVAYARDTTCDFKCEREGSGDASAATSGSSFMRTLFSRSRAPTAGCAARDCCVPRARPPGWLACDDDLVKPISDEEFEDLLSAEPKMRSAATPYLLFYVKTDVG